MVGKAVWGPPEEAGQEGVVEGEASGVGWGGEALGVGFELGGVGFLFAFEEGFEALPGVGGGLVVDDPEVGGTGGEGGGSCEEGSVESDGLRGWVFRGASGEGVFGGGFRVGGKEPLALGVVEGAGQAAYDGLGERGDFDGG